MPSSFDDLAEQMPLVHADEPIVCEAAEMKVQNGIGKEQITSLDVGSNDIDYVKTKLGLMPHITGLEFFVWLSRERQGQMYFVEATPDRFYVDDERVTILIEPDFIDISGTLDFEQFNTLQQFVRLNYDLIEAYWDGRLIDGEEVVRGVKRVVTTDFR